MARRVLTKQTNFASGELSSSLDGRTDLDRYYNGARSMLNWYPVVQGGVRRAPGTMYVAEVFGKTRLVSFEASSDDQYLFVLRDLLLDIYKDDVKVQTLDTPWPASDLFELDYTQALDTCIVVHTDHAPRRVYRDSSDVFHIEDLTDTANTIHITNIPTEPKIKRWFPSLYHFVGDIIQDDTVPNNGYYYTCTVPGTSGSSRPTFVASPTPGVTTMSDGGVTWLCTGLVADVQLWKAGTYPQTTTFHEDRLVFGGTADYPHRIWLSQSGDYFNFDQGTGLASDAVDREILADELPSIQWLYSGRRLVIGTTIGEFAVIQSDAITPSEMNLKKQTSIGSSRVNPVEVDGSVLHLTGNRSQVRELLFNDVEQAFTTRSLSTLSPNAVANAVQLASKAALSYDDANLVYAVNGNGTLGVLSTLREQEFLAWCPRTFTGEAESVASVGETIYIVVSYKFGLGVFEDEVFESGVFEETGGSSNRLLCKFDDDARMDFQTTSVSVTPKTSWSGFTYLGGSEVQLLVDDIYVGTTTVSEAGVITTTWEASTITAGIAIPTPTLTPMPVNFDGQQGSISHLLKRLVRVYLELVGTKSLVVDGDQINFREADHDVFAAVEAFSGIKDITKLGWDREATLTLTAPEPLPVTILSITREVGY